MNARIRAFGAFWCDFIVGDDWRVAAWVVVALVITATVSLSSVPAWWIVPVAVAVVLPYRVWRARRR